MKIALFPINDVDVSVGTMDLLDYYKENSPEIFIPVTTETQVFAESVFKLAIEQSIKVTCFINSAEHLDHILKQADDIVVCDIPGREMIRNLSPGDAVGITWDDEGQSHFLAHAVEDMALDVWDITGKASMVDLESCKGPEDLMELMKESLAAFIAAFSEHIAAVVRSAVDDVIEFQQQNKQEGD